jgi:hypothetical protein
VAPLLQERYIPAPAIGSGAPTTVLDWRESLLVMEIRDGLIHRHRVYWGWLGLKLLQEGGHHAK